MSSKRRRSSNAAPSEGVEPPFDEFCHNELFDLMGNRRRRYILYYLVRQTGPIECSELAEQIAAWENESSNEQVSSGQYQSVYNSLYQTHFPRLEATGLVEYDRSENLVYPSNQIAEIELFIDSVASRIHGRSLHGIFALVSGIVLGVAMAGSIMLLFAGNLYATFGVALVTVGAVVIGGLIT